MENTDKRIVETAEKESNEDSKECDKNPEHEARAPPIDQSPNYESERRETPDPISVLTPLVYLRSFHYIVRASMDVRFNVQVLFIGFR